MIKCVLEYSTPGGYSDSGWQDFLTFETEDFTAEYVAFFDTLTKMNKEYTDYIKKTQKYQSDLYKYIGSIDSKISKLQWMREDESRAEELAELQKKRKKLMKEFSKDNPEPVCPASNFTFRKLTIDIHNCDYEMMTLDDWYKKHEEQK